MRRWVRFERRWHSLNGDAETLCGVRFLEAPKAVEADDDEVPPEPCGTCLVDLAMADVEDESLEDAKARGYLRGDLDGGGPVEV